MKLSKFWSLFLIILQALFHNSVHFIRTFFWSGRQRVAFLDLRVYEYKIAIVGERKVFLRA